MSHQGVYDHQKIEKKWQHMWEKNQLFQGVAQQQASDPLYLLFAFAYPSGSGLHVGHVESKTALDILARYYRMRGKDVFFPVGWDAFGLPAENYAIKTGTPPEITTKNAINTFRQQLKRIGISYDWQGEIATSHPDYYQWTQWIFSQLYDKGLAYQAMGRVNWCPSCQTVLANEQVVDGLCERCDTQVEQKEMKQWYFRITKYQEELISGLEEVDWPQPTKQQQLHWIGKKEGINIEYHVVTDDGVVVTSANEDTPQSITCFTTRPDTNFGATFVVVAPEHQFVKKIIEGDVAPQQDADKIVARVKKYTQQAERKTELERQQEGRTKTGVFTGFYAVNQLTDKKMPIWISDFVLSGFGTGAVVGVPGHDKRDFEFAQYVNHSNSDQEIEVIRVVVANDGDDSPITQLSQVQEDEGVMINSGFLDGLDIHQATQKIMEYLEEKKWGTKVTTYKLRDWLISRQRYWGAPIPVIYDPDGKPHLIKEKDLPWELPIDVDFKPTGESPLRSSQELQQRTEQYAVQEYAQLIKDKGWDSEGKGWKPEYDTMDTFVCSSWYYLRYTDPRNNSEFASREQLKKWMPVDFYMIGPEHIVLHLLYSRFFTKFLRDQGYLDFDEPFLKMRHQGMILGPDGKKMSKSKGNVVNPDDVIEKFGADTLRTYEMFMGPIEADKPWDVSAVAGVYRFLSRIHSLVIQQLDDKPVAEVSSDNLESQKSPELELERKFHQTIKKVTQDIPQLKFNTAIAAMMEFVNVWEDVLRAKKGRLTSGQMIDFCKLLAPFAPFLAEELYRIQIQNSDRSNSQGDRPSIHLSQWPNYDQSLVEGSSVTIPVQVNGKVRGEVKIARSDIEQTEVVVAEAKQQSNVWKWISTKTVVKQIYVPGKILNFVVT